MQNLKKKIYKFFFSGPKITDLEQEAEESRLSFYGSTIYLTIHHLIHYAIVGILFIVFALVGFSGGYALGIIHQQDVPTVKQLSQQINHSKSSSSFYYADGEKIATVNPDTKIIKASSSQITPLVKKAVTATEDENFYEHHGVLPKSIVRAVLSELTGVGVQTGGSTLTQQLVKMQFLTSQTTWRRKITEMLYAKKIEKHFTKNEILTAYLNAAPYGKNNSGQNIVGINTAAQGIFGKSIKDLNLAQVAFLAGLPQSPSYYTPYDSNGYVKKDLELAFRRKDIVLFRMYRNGDITKAQYKSAMNYNLKKDFLNQEEAPEVKKKNSYIYNLVANKGVELIAESLIKNDGLQVDNVKKDTNRYNQYLNTANTLLQQKGYQIHTTFKKSLYTTMNDVVKDANLGEDKESNDYDTASNKWVKTTEHVQNGSIMIDNQTGAILAFSGGINFEDSQINHAFNTYRSPGSSIKPYLVYGPAIENKIISSQTAIADFPTKFGKYIPTDYDTTVQNKFINAQSALAHSYNLPAVNIYNTLKNKNIDLKSTMNKLGLPLTQKEYRDLGIALGGTSDGFSVAQNASAFSNFYNNGNRSESYYIDEIKDPSGRVIYKHKTKKHKVFSTGTSYIMQHMLHQVVKDGGTASSLNNSLNFNTENLIGKTGTSNDYRDIWFNGSTPGVTISSWLGYDNFYGHTYNLNSDANSTNLDLWSKMANALYKENPDVFKLNDTTSQPATVHRNTVLKSTGTLPGSVMFDGEQINLSGATTTALSLTSAPQATAEFAIGGSTDDYKLFYDHYQGADNKYGHTLLYTGKTISTADDISSLFVENSENSSQANEKKKNVARQGQDNSNSEQTVKANDQEPQNGQGGNTSPSTNQQNNVQTR